MISFGSGWVIISEKPDSEWKGFARGLRVNGKVSRIMTYPGLTS
jgi:hypothetical protein